VNDTANEVIPLRVQDIKQWAYCPRIVFYQYVMPVDKKITYKMTRGHVAEEAIDRLERRRKLAEFGLTEGRRRFHFWCGSQSLGLSGKLDLVIESEEGIFPVDFKFTEQRVHPNHILQLAAYAVLLEEQLGRPIDRGFVFLVPQDHIESISLDEHRKNQVREYLAQIRQAISSESMPPPTDVRARCEECEYRNYCGDVL
jgi:CRISPR-associated exonuclease Cas4